MLQGLNNWVSGNVKQTPHDPNMVWASNQYLIVFQVFYKFFWSFMFPTERLERGSPGLQLKLM
jgi:hypothetical protein